MQDRFWVVLLTPLLGNGYINHFYRSMSESNDVEQCHGLLLFYHIKLRFHICHLILISDLSCLSTSFLMNNSLCRMPEQNCSGLFIDIHTSLL